MTEYNKIVAVTGLPGLYELISSKTDGAIVRSLDDKNTKFISSRIHKVTQLETIEVFTVKDNVNLVDVFKAMDGADKLPDDKDNGELNKYFKKVFPDLDFEKVYASDMKKMVKWFSALKNNNIELKLSEPPVEEEPVVEENKEEPVVVKKVEREKETKPKKAVAETKTVTKKKAEPAKKETKSEKKEKEDKPKKAAAKTKSKKK
jgi:hypothetical protein